MREEPFFVDGPLRRDLTEAVQDRWSQDGRVGAQAWFFGQIRDDPIAGGRVTAIEYDAERVIAAQSLAEIAARAVRECGCREVWIRHSLGGVPAGGVSFIVGVAAEHRGAAFDALRLTVDAVKAETPIFGKEITAAGYRWKVNQ
jgi:molybdopterin synthase catalytic subunit